MVYRPSSDTALNTQNRDIVSPQMCCIYLPYGFRHSRAVGMPPGVVAPRSQWRSQAAGGDLARRMCSEGVHLVVLSSSGSNVAGL